MTAREVTRRRAGPGVEREFTTSPVGINNKSRYQPPEGNLLLQAHPSDQPTLHTWALSRVDFRRGTGSLEGGDFFGRQQGSHAVVGGPVQSCLGALAGGHARHARLGKFTGGTHEGTLQEFFGNFS